MLWKLVSLMASVFILSGCCGSGRTRTPPKPSTPAEARTIRYDLAYKMMSELDSFVVLDVRTEQEYREKHIRGALLIPDYEIRSRARTEIPDTNEVILVYCRTGRRSALAAEELACLGYVNVYDFGGLNRWPYATVSEE